MDIKDVGNLAKLARLELNEEEKAQILSDMKGILEYVKQIERVEVDDVQTSPGLINAWREDLPESRNFSRKLLVGQFPEAQDGFLKVKKIL